MPDHFHFISNPQDGCIIEFCRDLKSKAAKAILETTHRFSFPESEEGREVWQESFKAIPLWSGWMINQKINYIHANPVKAKLVKLAGITTGPALGHSAVREINHWLWIMTGGGQMMQRNWRRR